MLVGLGLGPGDPELLTLRAVRLLREADAVFVPGRIARDLVAPYRDAEILSFPMTEDEAAIRKVIEEHADRIAPHAERGLAVFGLLGDPNLFSTYGRLVQVIREKHPQIPCTSEPGVSAITAWTAAAGISLSEGFEVSDGSEPRCRILLKVRNPREDAERLKRLGYSEFILLERMYMPDARIYPGTALPEKSDYMSILVARR
ncbi:MAG: cobalt-factor II C(20)-methyltransferase [Methanomicrobiales archaeon]|nr:cobalt-factor II C(20)-methyltransferase [Methanomicrobiales archaeon]MDI6876425.1 cobalt-factor II C(20)-methyltransferase [Methanomicrobiales archaeon]